MYFYRVATLMLNFGPQHPAAHGVLRLVIRLFGESILEIDCQIGLLHRGTEKLIEYKTYFQSIPYFDRLDYVSTMVNEYVYVKAVENLLGVTIPGRAKLIRLFFYELTRILNHLLALTTHALDLGAITPFLWAFEEREKLLELYERVSGARFHTAYFRFGGLSYDIPTGTLEDVASFLDQFIFRLFEVEDLVRENRVFRQRLVNIGMTPIKLVKEYGLSGVLLRSVGIPWDLRLTSMFKEFRFLKFKVPVGLWGDCFDRFILRLFEMKESARIVKSCLENMVYYKYMGVKVDNFKVISPGRGHMKYSMESLIHHFKFYAGGPQIPADETYSLVEAPKGEMGVFVKSNGSARPYRCHIKAPGFLHLQSLDALSRHSILADMVAGIGTLDLVFGEIDR